MEANMYGLEKELFEQVLLLKQDYKLEGIKAEFEAEGSQFNDIVRLRRLTAQAGVKLFLKIGGVEAVRDIKDSLELGVDGIISPMVESAFGLKKFLDAYHSIYRNHKMKLSINIETKNSIDQLDDILSMAKGEIDNITLGRTDLSASYMQQDIVPDCDFIFALVGLVGKKSRHNKLSFTVGGSISAKTIQKFRENHSMLNPIECLETRKVVLPAGTMVFEENALNEALKFEELYILSKKQISDVMMDAELKRISKLTARAATEEVATAVVA
jgi:4-hydroxy-2-oxoheptanedioate aldolase